MAGFRCKQKKTVHYLSLSFLDILTSGISQVEILNRANTAIKESALSRQLFEQGKSAGISRKELRIPDKRIITNWKRKLLCLKLCSKCT